MTRSTCCAAGGVEQRSARGRGRRSSRACGARSGDLVAEGRAARLLRHDGRHPAPCSHAPRCRAAVVLPLPSGPSSVMNRPRSGGGGSRRREDGGHDERQHHQGEDHEQDDPSGSPAHRQLPRRRGSARPADSAPTRVTATSARCARPSGAAAAARSAWRGEPTGRPEASHQPDRLRRRRAARPPAAGLQVEERGEHVLHLEDRVRLEHVDRPRATRRRAARTACGGSSCAA